MSKWGYVAFLVLGLTMNAHASDVRKIAFVDTGNTGRSVSAEALAGAIAQQKGLKVSLISRGVDMDPFDIHPEPNAVTLLKARGLDVSTHIAQ